jgi:hypothetical protein
MQATAVHFLAVVLSALAVIPGGAHVLELPAKIALERDAYLTVQQIYRGWAWTGAVIIAALIANVWLAWRRRGNARRFAAAAASLIVSSLVVFFVWTFPVNQATANWTTVSGEDWASLRARWEYSHLVGATLMFAAFCCALLSGLLRRD